MVLQLNFRGDNHRESDYRVAKLIFLILKALTVIPLIFQNLILIQCIVITRNFDMSTQFCHITRDFSFLADVLLLGIWVKRVDNELELMFAH